MRWKVFIRILVLGLLSSALLAPVVSSSPYDERLEIDMEMELTDIIMPVSTQHISEVLVPGWVDVLDKPPAERVTVEVVVEMQGQFVINAAAYPGTQYFTYTGRQYFNLSLRLAEDTPPGREYLMDVIANAEGKVGFDSDVVHMTVTTVPELAGDAEVFEAPGEVPPGGVANGLIEVRNTGTRYAEYRLTVADDPGEVVEELRFTIEVEMTPNWVEKTPFVLKVDRDARPGTHRIEVQLMVVNDDGGTTNVDRFVIDLVVVEDEEPTFDWYTATVIVLVLVSIVAVIAFILRRKA